MAWAGSLAALLARLGISPNQISIASIVFGALAGTCLFLTGRTDGATQTSAFLTAAAFMQLRLLANLMDGMVAVEHSQRTSTGELFNDIPDRFADGLILVGAGYATAAPDWTPVLGWSAALLSLMTAYVRVLGGSLGLRQDFRGPMGKPQRMAALTIASLIAGFTGSLQWHGWVVPVCLGAIVLGSAVTVLRRILGIAGALR